MVVSGLSLTLWAFLVLQPSAPPQEAPVLGMTQGQKEAAAPEGQADVACEPGTDASGLYPDMVGAGDYLGTITLPSLSLSWPIFEGTTEDELSRGVGHHVGSVMPGVLDNSVLSGHRTTVFGRLGELELGDLIYVETSAGRFTYQVHSFRVVPRTDSEVIVPTPTAVLTLTTCHPFNSLVHTTDAFVVTAELIGSQFPEPPEPPRR
jgi:sortase A